MGVYFSGEQVRKSLQHNCFLGIWAPWAAVNSNSGQLDAKIEFWQVALTLDDGALLASMGLTAYADEQIRKATAWKANPNTSPNGW